LQAKPKEDIIGADGGGAVRMETSIKVQIVLSIFLTLELLALYMILIRTVANLEYAFNRIEAIINRELQLSMRAMENEKKLKEKVEKNDMSKTKKNDLLLNIPFMDRLNQEKKKDGNA
jgi:hypothetical protein